MLWIFFFEEMQKDLIARTDHGKKRFEHSELYRIFYYDCPPVDKNVYHPLKRMSVNFKKHPTYLWMREFLEALKTKRKLALRLGFLAADEAVYNLKPDIVKKTVEWLKGTFEFDGIGFLAGNVAKRR